MSGSRDDFLQPIKQQLASRVSYRCSNPECRKTTIGPNTEDEKAVNIGVAAHITAAAKGGKRYNPNLLQDERKGFTNGIWLCQNCAKLIDSDEKRYTVQLIRTWKSVAEQLALAEIQTVSHVPIGCDIDLIRFYATCFNRSAFQDEVRQEGSIEDFEQAIDDTIIALNTGVLKDRNGNIIKESKGIFEVANSEWRDKLALIMDMLVVMRRRLKYARDEQLYHTNMGYNGISFYVFHDHDFADWFDASRFDLINIFSSICEEAGLQTFHFPRKRHWRGCY